MSEDIAEYKTRLDQRIEDTESALLQAEIDHSFNWWWYNEGSIAPQHGDDLCEHTERQCRKAFEQGTKMLVIPLKPQIYEEIPFEKVFAILALGIVIGVAMGFGIALLTKSPL